MLLLRIQSKTLWQYTPQPNMKIIIILTALLTISHSKKPPIPTLNNLCPLEDLPKYTANNAAPFTYLEGAQLRIERFCEDRRCRKITYNSALRYETINVTTDSTTKVKSLHYESGSILNRIPTFINDVALVENGKPYPSYRGNLSKYVDYVTIHTDKVLLNFYCEQQSPKQLYTMYVTYDFKTLTAEEGKTLTAYIRRIKGLEKIAIDYTTGDVLSERCSSKS